MSAAHQLSQPNPSFLTRVLDSVDRGHAKAAAMIHGARNTLHATLERSLDRAELMSTSMIGGARKRLQRIDVVSADAVNRAQGVVGQAIEKARLARSKPEHVSH